ncbi:MAG: anti-virulence regulator CigR family protein [Gemmatimonadota bacterium]
MTAKRSLFVSLILGAALHAVTPGTVSAQGRGKQVSQPAVTASASITLTKDMQIEIRNWYVQHPIGNVEALPPGIRKRLARGKPLPPGIAKKVAPSGLRSGLRLPHGYQVFEVGLDVLLVEVATSIVHDILTDVVR